MSKILACHRHFRLRWRVRPYYAHEQRSLIDTHADSEFARSARDARHVFSAYSGVIARRRRRLPGDDASDDAFAVI